MQDIKIERIDATAPDSTIHGLAELLVDAVEGNAGVSFMAGLTLEEATAWWRRVLAQLDPRAVVLVARDGTGTAGTVQLQPAWAPNQPHRGDVAKLIVHRRARGRGIARDLMRELERYGRHHGYTLLLLDTCKGGAAERLYASLGWVRAGEVPRFALNPDGSLCDTVFFYRDLGVDPARARGKHGTI